jgi:hypothetical protein
MLVSGWSIISGSLVLVAPSDRVAVSPGAVVLHAATTMPIRAMAAAAAGRR